MKKAIRACSIMTALVALTGCHARDAIATKALVVKSLAQMVAIPGGTYTMGPTNPNWQSGNTYPPHTVTLTGFYISKFNVSYGEYDSYTHFAGLPLVHPESYQLHSFDRTANHPVNFIDWYQANDYCQWLAKKTRLPFDLPTEAQWEYVARNLGKPHWVFATNNGQQELGKNFPNEAMFDAQPGNIGGVDLPLPVGSLPCTPMGICGMNGEVEQWVKDWYSPDYYSHSPVNNPQGPATGTQKVTRSGGAQDDPMYDYNFDRYGDNPNHAIAGFRCVINSTLPMAQLKAQALQRS